MVWLDLTMTAYSTNQSLDVGLKFDCTIIIISVIKIFRQLIPKPKRHLGHLLCNQIEINRTNEQMTVITAFNLPRNRDDRRKLAPSLVIRISARRSSYRYYFWWTRAFGEAALQRFR